MQYGFSAKRMPKGVQMALDKSMAKKLKRVDVVKLQGRDIAALVVNYLPFVQICCEEHKEALNIVQDVQASLLSKIDMDNLDNSENEADMYLEKIFNAL